MRNKMALLRPIITITLLILFCQVLLAQQKTEAYFGESGRSDVSNDILEMYDKSYYISGGFEGSGDYHFGWNIKTDINLELIYDKVFEHPLCTVGNFVSVSDEHGNIYVSGFATISGGWPFITKIDSCGNKVWCKILEYNNEFEDGYNIDILISKNNEIILLVNFDSEEEIDKLHLVGLNESGDVLWVKPYASKNDYSWIREPIGYDLEVINNDYYISGRCYWPYPDDTTHFYLRPLFIGIDSLFEEKWILPFAPLDSVFGVAYNTIAINDSIILGVGERWLGEEIMNSLFMYFNTNGEELSYNQIQNEDIGSDIQFNAIRDIEKINDSTYLSPLYVGIDFETYFGEIVFDTSGAIYNQEIRDIYKGTSSIIKTSDNNFLIEIEVAESKSDNDIYLYKIDENLNDVPFDPTPHNYDSLCSDGIQSGTTDLSDCLVWTNIEDAPSPQEYYASIKQIPIKAYPNPVSKGQITFEFENTEHHNNIELKCFDLYGKEIFSKKVYRYQTEAVVDITKLKQGMYLAVVYSNGFPVGECKFVVQ